MSVYVSVCNAYCARECALQKWLDRSRCCMGHLGPRLVWAPHTHTHPFNGPFSRTTWVSWYQKGKTNLDFTVARDSERQWHQLGHMQVCTSLQTDNHASTPPLSVFTGRMPFLPPNQQRQSTEGMWAPKNYVLDGVHVGATQ